MCIAVVAFDQLWVIVPLSYGFVARVATGPTLSPLGQLVVRVIIPKLNWDPKYVPGPPKRFAQGIGATLSLLSLSAWLISGSDIVARVLVGMILIAASLESFAGFCLGCWIFSGLMKLKIVPESVCEACVIPPR